jgi:tRNA (guanine-N7-)-methyltransferase
MPERNYHIEPNQIGIHNNLTALVQKHQVQPFQKPPNQLQQTIFNRLSRLVDQQGRPLILDCGCGAAMSTVRLAQRYPHHLIIGMDKSLHRLMRHAQFKRYQQHALAHWDNIILVQANLVDQMLLMTQANWQFDQQYHLYPNPWPKSKHLARRWHGHAIFPTLMALSKVTEIRSNWLLYLQEWQYAAQLLGYQTQAIEAYQSNTPLTHFEAKYLAAGEPIYRLRSWLPSFSCPYRRHGLQLIFWL